MAQTTHLPPSITSSLEHLSTRPGVLATLIISRHNGSIIRATGTLASNESEASSPKKDIGNVHDNKPITTADAQLQSNIDGTSPRSHISTGFARNPTSAELLASSIFQFVGAATNLCSQIQPRSSDDESRATILGTARDKHETENNLKFGQQQNTTEQTDDSQVQLLRMRTKNHEIVIFPDPKFICCVMQEMGKGSHESTTVGGR